MVLLGNREMAIAVFQPFSVEQKIRISRQSRLSALGASASDFERRHWWYPFNSASVQTSTAAGKDGGSTRTIGARRTSVATYYTSRKLSITIMVHCLRMTRVLL